MEQLDTFLRHHPPFDELSRAEIAELVADAQVCDFPVGLSLLLEDGPPAQQLGVVLSGSLELVHEGQVIQVLEPGECFGHPSLLTGLAPEFTVRVHTPMRCALFPKAAGLRVLGTPSGARYVARSMRARLTRIGHTVHAMLDVGTTPVSAVMGPPRFVAADVPVREAAQALGEEHTTALLVDLDSRGLGLVTDAEVRRAVAEDRASADRPVGDIARTPLPAIPVGQLAVEATVDMLAADTEHVAVLEGGRVVGVVSAGDLLGLEVRSPIALRHLILGAADEDELRRAAARLRNLFALLMAAGVPSRDIGRVLSLQHDAVVARLVDFSVRRHGDTPVAWTWLDLGSAARREFTLGSDQDNGLAYAQPPEGAEAEIDSYFARLGSEVNSGLAACGIGVDNNGVLAGERRWRMSKEAWVRTFHECLLEPSESHLIRATVAFDFRPTAGGLGVAAALTDEIRAARQYPAFMRLIARGAVGFQVALTFRGNLALDKRGRLDLKSGGITPLVNLVRFHALANGVTISPTADRIDAVESVGGLSHEAADALREAFAVITRVRFQRHADAIASGKPVDNLVDPAELTPIVRTELREALAVVRRAQRQLGVYTPATT